MAARAPTAYAATLDDTTIVSGEFVLASHLDQIVENQHFALRSARIEIAAGITPAFLAGAAGAAVELCRWTIMPRDLCDSGLDDGGLQFAHAYALVRVEAASTDDFNIIVASASDSITYDYTGSETEAWIDLNGEDDLQIATNGTADTIILSAQKQAGGTGTGRLFILGFMLVSDPIT
jgi:hypothetical protein